MINPYLSYAFSFSIALVTYLLGWSDLYPTFSVTVVVFLVSTIVLHAVAGIKFSANKLAVFKKLELSNHLSPLWVTLFLYILWCAEFFHAGGVPFLNILLKKPYDYRLFGIPTLHVFVVTFSSFYTIFLFHLYLSKRSSWLLTLYLVNLFAALLIYNRGMLLFNMSASASLLLIYQRKLMAKHVALGIAGMVMILFLFGVLGSLRVSNESRVPYSNELFFTTGQASQQFRNSGIPGEFFWSYMYSTSPLANLETNVTRTDAPRFSVSAFLRWLNNEVLFDFISKRINHQIRAEKPQETRILGPFNATTVYSRSFSYLGWWGLLFMASLILLIPVFYTRIASTDSPFFLTGLVILNTIFLFMVFENTLRFTGFSFQFVYPVLFSMVWGKLPKLKKHFIGY